MAPKTFISYCGKDREIAQRLKKDLKRAGCDPWQFDLSAVPGTDAWATILETIEKSDFVVVLLSQAATASRAVQAEISHAHYCGINNPEGRPTMIPLILENEVAVPRQIARVVHLPFREVQYNSDFEHLLLSLGVEASPFALTSDLHVTFSRGRVFDVEREVAIYASSLIRNNPNVSSVFESLSENVRRAAGGRWRMPSAQTVIWQAETFRAARQPQFVRASEWTVMVVFALHAGYSSGYESKERVIIEIAASDLLKYDYIGERPDTVLHSHTLELKFEGFRNLVASPVE